jgi:hypothetical protein
MAKVTGSEMVAEAGGSVKKSPVLVVGFGRGDAGKSTVLALMVYRARNKGRDVLVADFDPQSKTLRTLFPDAIKPESDELPDVKSEFVKLLNRVSKGESGVVDFGGGDQFMKEFGKDLQVVQFCKKRGIRAVAVFVLSPDQENLNHILSVFDSGHFMPEEMIIILNEGVIREGKTVKGAFDDTLADEGFKRMVKAGAKPLLLTRLPCMGLLKKAAASDVNAMDFYAAGAGDVGLDVVESFMSETWTDDFEHKLKMLGIEGWLP